MLLDLGLLEDFVVRAARHEADTGLLTGRNEGRVAGLSVGPDQGALAVVFHHIAGSPNHLQCRLAVGPEVAVARRCPQAQPQP